MKSPIGSARVIEAQRRVVPAATSIPHSGLAVTIIFVIALQLLAVPTGAGPVTALSQAKESGKNEAVELDAAARSLVGVELAIKRFETRDFDGCIRQLTGALKGHPELPPPHALFAKLAFMTNQGALIRPALELAAGEDGKHPEVFILFGNFALAEGRTTDAAVHFEKATTLACDSRWTAEQRKRFGRLCNQGTAVVAENRRDWKAAKITFETWLNDEPGLAQVRQRLGRVLFHLGETEAAYETLQKAAQADPKLEPPAVTMGWLFARAGNGKKAGEWMDYAAKSTPDSLPVQLGVAAWLLEEGRGDEAQSHVDVAAKIKPDSIEIKRTLGLAARQRKALTRAEQIFQELADLAPADAWTRNQLALVLAEQNDAARRQKALQLSELSVRQAPKDAAALGTLGTVYYHLNRLEDAEKVLQAVVGSGKASSDAAYVLARIKAARGQPAAVEPLLKIALGAPGIFICRKDAQDWRDRLAAKAK